MIAYLDPGGGSDIGPLEIVVLVFLLAVFGSLVAGVVLVVRRSRRPPVAPPYAAAPSDHLDRVQKITELRNASTLTAEEFETEKARIMGERASGGRP